MAAIPVYLRLAGIDDARAEAERIGAKPTSAVDEKMLLTGRLVRSPVNSSSAIPWKAFSRRRSEVSSSGMNDEASNSSEVV